MHLPVCSSCHGAGVFREHACAHVFDEFHDASELQRAALMLVHPDIALPGRRRVETRVARPSVILPGRATRPVFAHHPVLLGQPYDSLLDGYQECPSHLCEVVYFLLLRSARFVVRSHVERSIGLSMRREWTLEYERVSLTLAESVSRRETVVLHRQFIGRVC